MHLNFINDKWLKPHIDFNTQNIEAKKNNKKDGENVVQINEQYYIPKKIKDLGTRITLRLAKNRKDYLECTSKPTYISHQIFDKNFVTIRKTKLALYLKRPAYIVMCI